MRFHRIVAGLVLAGATIPALCPAFDKPTGSPLAMSDIETEQPIPLAYLSPEGKAGCSNIRLHWSPSPNVTTQDDTASFTLDIAADSPGAATFTAQLWSASLAGSLAWQKPWQGAHWKIFETPDTDGTGIDAALAVGMISTSARRPYPKDTLVIGNLHPDSSLGAVSRLADRLDAAAKAGIKRVIIPKAEQFETDGSGGTVNIMRHAEELNLKCIPVENIVEATRSAHRLGSAQVQRRRGLLHRRLRAARADRGAKRAALRAEGGTARAISAAPGRRVEAGLRRGQAGQRRL